MLETTPYPSETPPPARPPLPQAALDEAWGTTGRPAVLQDPPPGAPPVPLDGPFERRGPSLLLTAALALVAGFLAMNVVGLVAALVLVVGQMGQGAAPDAEAVLQALASDATSFLLLNAVSLAAAFGLVAWLFARGHSSRPGGYLRLRTPDPVGLALAVAGLVALIPLVQWLGSLTQTLPYPDWLGWLEEQERMQVEMIEAALQPDGPGVVFLLLTMAFAPALCEELLFRGYLHRQAERRLGAAWAVGLVGVVFALYHFRPTQALPLALLGVYLGYVTWVTGSLWPAVAVHFLNNALAVGAAAYVRSHPELDLQSVEAVPVPWYLALASAALALGVARALHRRREALVTSAPAALRPPSTPAPPAPPLR